MKSNDYYDLYEKDPVLKVAGIPVPEIIKLTILLKQLDLSIEDVIKVLEDTRK